MTARSAAKASISVDRVIRLAEWIETARGLFAELPPLRLIKSPVMLHLEGRQALDELTLQDLSEKLRGLQAEVNRLVDRGSFLEKIFLDPDVKAQLELQRNHPLMVGAACMRFAGDTGISLRARDLSSVSTAIGLEPLPDDPGTAESRWKKRLPALKKLKGLVQVRVTSVRAGDELPSAFFAPL